MTSSRNNGRFANVRHVPILLLAMICLAFTVPLSLQAGSTAGLFEREIPAGSPARPFRFVEGDRGDPIPYLVDMETLPGKLTEDEVLSAVKNAFAAWSGATGLRFVFERAVTFSQPASDFTSADGRIRVQCHDLHGAISTREVLGISGSGAESGGFPEGGYGGRVYGEEFHRTVRGFVIVNHRHRSLETLATFEAVMCHEIGHILGLDHSSASYPEPDEVLRESMMYARVHSDGRGATLTDYDRVTARKAYPPDNTPPGVFPTAMSVVTVPDGAGLAMDGVNTIRLAAVDLQDSVADLEATLHHSTTSEFGLFSIEGNTLTYAGLSDFDRPRLDPLGISFYDRAIFRINDGPHSSAYESVRVVGLSRDTQPAGSPDGMPDRWMIEHFGSSTPVAGVSGASDDFDGDGDDNFTEFLRQTDPGNPNSRLRLAFTAASSSATEQSGSVLVTIAADQILGRTVSVPFLLGGTTRGAGVDYSLPGGTGTGGDILIPAGLRYRSLGFDIVDDGVPEISETIQISLKASTDIPLEEPSLHTITIAGDVEAPVYDFSSGTMVVSETNGASSIVTATITRSGNTDLATAVSVFLMPATVDPALPGIDFSAEPRIVNFEPGQIAATFTVEILDDRVHEPSEHLVLTFGDFQPFGISGTTQPSAQVTIDDDDLPPQVSIGDTFANEAADGFEFEVILSEVSGFPVSVRYRSEPLSASPGIDYTEAEGRLTILPGEQRGIVHVLLINDSLDEADETIEVVLSDSEGAVLSDRHATGTILDNDPLPRLKFFGATGDENEESLRFLALLSAPSGREISIRYTTKDLSASAGADYIGKSRVLSLVPGVTSRTIDVEILQDRDEEGIETFALEVSDPINVILEASSVTGTIHDATPIPRLTVGGSMAVEGDGIISFPVRLSIPLEQPLTARYRLRGVTAQPGLDFSEDPEADQEVIFPPGVTEVSIPVFIQDDTLDEENEQLLLELIYNGEANSQVEIFAQGIIVDDDPPPKISLEPADALESEGAIAVVVHIVPPSGRPIQIEYETVDGTAVQNEDYESRNDIRIIPPLTEQFVVWVPVDDDERVEQTESFYFKISNSENAFHEGESVKLTLFDNDQPRSPEMVTRWDNGVRGGAILWQGIEGFFYEIHTSQDLRDWMPLGNDQSRRASGLVQSIEELPVWERQLYYRIRKIAQD